MTLAEPRPLTAPSALFTTITGLRSILSQAVGSGNSGTMLDSFTPAYRGPSKVIYQVFSDTG